MPNQRSAQKKQIGLWLTGQELKMLNEMCIRYRKNRTELFKSFIEAECMPATSMPKPRKNGLE